MHSVGPGIWKKKKKTLTNEEFEEQTWQDMEYGKKIEKVEK